MVSATADRRRRPGPAQVHRLRAGCSRLIFAEHRPLPPADQQWLIENCRTWGRKLDRQLAALESGQNVLEVRDETDVLVRHVIDELPSRPKKPRSTQPVPVRP